MSNYSKKAQELFCSGYNCAQAIVLAFKDLYDVDEITLKKLSSSFGGGVARLREICGCVTGMAMVLGMIYGDYDVLDNDAKARQYARIQELAFKFKDKFKTYNCAELLNKLQGLEPPTPDKRTEEYYKIRPCAMFIGEMALIIEEYLRENNYIK